MSSKSKQKKQHHKTTTEIIKDQERSEEVKRQRKLVKDVLYDYLLKNSKSIEDAKNMCYATAVAVQQAFHNKIAERQMELSKAKLKELDMKAQLKEGDEASGFKGLVELLEEETIATTDNLLNGLKQVIESFEREEATTRTLDTLKATFLE